MNNLCLTFLISLLCVVHFKVPIRLIEAVQMAQADFDGQIFSGKSCRSTFEDRKSRIFSFSESLFIPCYFERIDYGARKTTRSWPKSVCVLKEHVNDKQTIEGGDPCDYQ